MKVTSITILICIPVVVFAKDYPGMNQADMQNMMQQMKKMQSCMENVDKQQLKNLEDRSHKMQSEVKSLCASGKRDQAQGKALMFAKDMSNDSTLKEMKKCGEQVTSMLPKMPYIDVGSGNGKDDSGAHICDDL